MLLIQLYIGSCLGFFASRDFLLLILYVSVSNVHIWAIKVKKYNVMHQFKN